MNRQSVPAIPDSSLTLATSAFWQRQGPSDVDLANGNS